MKQPLKGILLDIPSSPFPITYRQAMVKFQPLSFEISYNLPELTRAGLSAGVPGHCLNHKKYRVY